MAIRTDDIKYQYDPRMHDNLGITRGQVIKNNDPKKIGRIQVRIPSYHGIPGMTDRFIEDKDLPWATPCFYGGCGQDMGSFLVPIPGTYVWLMFEDNDVEKPVYLGGVPSIGSSLSKTVNNLGDSESPQQPWNTEPGMADVAWDEFIAGNKPTGVPERGVIFKSQKGHTIMFDDTDGEESMSFLDRVGQVIKFFCGVTKGKNAEKYHRELNSAENNSQLGEGVVEEPSIMMRSGETKEDTKVHSMIRMYRDHMRMESIDADNDKHTSTDYAPNEYNQETQKSILNMQEEHIYFDFKESMIHEHFCESYWALKAFETSYMECTPDHLFIHYKDNGLFIDESQVKLHFKDTTIILNEETIKGNAKKEFLFEADGTTISGDKDKLSGKSKEINFEGSGKVYTENGKTYLVGTEIHFNK